MMQADLLLNALLRLTVLTSAALLLLALLRPLVRPLLGARATYAAWLLLPLVLASPWLPESPLPAPAHLALPATGERAPADATAPAATAPATTAHDGQLTLLLIWLLGVASVATVHWRAQRRYQQCLQRDAGGQWWAPAGHSPAVVGFWPAQLVLPADFAVRFDAPTRQLMLTHEAVHLRRHDNTINLLATLLLCLQWFNPLAWWGWRAVRADQELACDETVLDSDTDPTLPARYARALLAAHQGPAHPALASGWTTSHPLVHRMQWLSRWRRTSRARRLAGVALVATLGVAAALVARAAQEPPAAMPTAADSTASEGLRFEVASQIGRRDWHHADMALPWNRPLLGGPSGVTVQMMQPGWCLYVSLYTFGDGSVRPTALPMDETCQRPLADAQQLAVNGAVTQFIARTSQGTLQAQVSARLTGAGSSPQSASSRATVAAQLSPAQQAQLARQHEEFAKFQRDMGAQDKAWRAARESQPGNR